MPNAREHWLKEFLAGLPFPDAKAALSIFARRSPTSDYTIGGEFVNLLSHEEDNIAEEILWIEPEFDADERTAKAKHMYPFAIKYSLQETVHGIHREFLQTPSSWEEKTKDWLSLSAIMDCVKKSSISPKPHAFLVMLNDNHQSAFVQSDWFKGGNSAHIYVNNGTAYFETNHGGKRLIQDLFPESEKRSFANFFQWLLSIRDIFPCFGVYAGLETEPHNNAKSVRLWAALSQQTDPHTLKIVDNFNTDFKTRYASKIESAIDHPLEVFWRRTRTESHSTITNEGKGQAQLRSLIQCNKEDWPWQISEAEVIATLKTMCGSQCAFEDSQGQDYRLSLLGAFFLVIGAIAAKFGPLQHWQSRVDIQLAEGARGSIPKLLPPQTAGIAKLAAGCFFGMFEELCMDEDRTKTTLDRLLIRRISLTAESLTVEVAIDPRSANKNANNNQGLAKTIGYAFTRFVRIPKLEKSAKPPEIALKENTHHSGTVGDMIASYALLSGIRVTHPESPSDEDTLFPVSTFRLTTKQIQESVGVPPVPEQRLVFRFSKCETS